MKTLLFRMFHRDCRVEIDQLKAELRAARRIKAPWTSIDKLPDKSGVYIVGAYYASAVTSNGWTVAVLREGVWINLLLNKPLSWVPTHFCEPGIPPSGWEGIP